MTNKTTQKPFATPKATNRGEDTDTGLLVEATDREKIPIGD